MIEIRGVSKRFGDHVALGRTDLQFAARQTHVLLGPSGCGKSTLLRLVLRLTEPDSGEVRVDGKAVTRDNVRAIRMRTGYVIQDGGLFPHLTARQNAEIAPRYLRWPASRLRERTAEAARLARFPIDALDRFPVELSGGQQQRLSLMRALMVDPELLLFDEPFGALDPLVRADLQREFKTLFAALGKTVVLVTHDLAEAAALADRVVLMRAGRVVQIGSFRDLYEKPADPFVKRFFEAQQHAWEERSP